MPVRAKLFSNHDKGQPVSAVEVYPRVRMMRYVPRIKEIRERRGIKQKWLAEQIGATSSMLSRWEGGEVFPTVPYLHRLCRVLGVRLEELYEEVED